MQKEIKVMLDMGVIEPSNNPWTSLVVLVPKRIKPDKYLLIICLIVLNPKLYLVLNIIINADEEVFL